MNRMRIKASYIWALIIALLVIAWMISDDLWKISSGQNDDDQSEPSIIMTDLGKIQPITVDAIKVKNISTPLIVRASGVTETLFEISIVARRQGVIEKINFSEGSWINAGNPIFELDRGTLESDLAAAKADRVAALAVYNDTKRKFSKNGEIAVQLKSAKANLEANKKKFEITKGLVEKGVQTELALSEKRALLRAAETRLFELKNLPKELELANSYARLKLIDSKILQLQEQLKFTKIVAPQRGWLEDLNVEIGEFVDENRPLARILGLQTLKLTIPIAQTSIDKINIADPVNISFAGSEVAKGKVDKIAAKANVATRTFNVEIKLDNPEGRIRAGMTAEAEIIIGEVEALKVSPAHLNVKDDGQLTVKIVNAQDRVDVIPVELVRTSGNFAYIAGVPDNATLLTAGQAFLNSGELVNYSLVKGSN